MFWHRTTGKPAAKSELEPFLGFKFAEHGFLGDSIVIRNSTGDLVRAGDWRLKLENGLELTYGQICGLAGDYYGTSEPISDGSSLDDQVRRFMLAFDQLARAQRTPKEALQILSILQLEVDVVNEAIKDHQDPWDIYHTLPDVTAKLEYETLGRPAPALSYLGLAAINWDHFRNDAKTAYDVGHRAALDVALQGGKRLELAYILNAFADHFLQDSFSAGHLRTPRRALHRSSNPTADLCAKYMHDEDSAIGLYVQNPQGIEFRMYGDRRLLSPGGETNVASCQQALQASSDEIYKAWHEQINPTEFRAWQYAPTLESASNLSAQELKPLFVVEEGVVKRRSDIENRRDTALTRFWTFAGTVSNCELSGRWTWPQPKMDPN
ncbi:MAG: hypothetical protein Q9214_006971 [Letrouitia sp. 1 TL-2023]